MQICDFIYNRNLNRNNNTEIFVITYGGTYNGEFNTWSHMLRLNNNLEGLFFLKKDTSISPINIGIDSNYYLVYGQEQGFISYSKNENWDFEANSLLSTSTTIDPLIAQINSQTNQNNVQNSCILTEKSGLVFQIDSIYPDNTNLNILTSLKGQWGKSYDLENLKIRINFSNPILLANLGLVRTPRTNYFANNYTSSIVQIDNNNIEVQLTLNSNAIQLASVNNNFNAFLQFSFSNAIVLSNVSSIKLTNATFKVGNHSINFNDFDFVNNHYMSDFFGAPDMKSFSPAEVCAGIKMDESIGNPIKDGYVIIKGTGFDNVAEDKFNTLMPNKYRVEFVRELDLNNDSHKIVPLPEDYEYWTDTEIKVRVPTAGWHVDNGGIDGPLSGVAVTGKINIITPGGSDSNPQNQSNKELIVKFAQFNTIDDINFKKSRVNKLWDNSGNGGYRFKFDSSFDDIYSDIQAAKEDVIEAFCEWNSITEAKLEVIDPNPNNGFRIGCKDFGTSGSGTQALAKGESQTIGDLCSDESVVLSMALYFNTNEKIKWIPSSDADPLVDLHIIKPTTYHEVGHLLQLGHTYNNNSTMHPFYKNTIVIDNDAKAGGTHVSEVSALVSCPGHLTKGINESCTTPITNLHSGLNSIAISPNPVLNEIFIKNYTPTSNDLKIEVITNLGTTLCKINNFNINNSIDVKSLSSGIYTIKLIDGVHILIAKFIKI